MRYINFSKTLYKSYNDYISISYRKDRIFAGGSAIGTIIRSYGYYIGYNNGTTNIKAILNEKYRFIQ